MTELNNRVLALLIGSAAFSIFAVAVLLLATGLFHFVAWEAYDAFPWGTVRVGIAVGVAAGFFFACSDEAAR